MDGELSGRHGAQDRGRPGRVGAGGARASRAGEVARWWFHGTNGQAAKLALRQEGDVRGRSPAAISFRGVVSETKDAFLARPAAWLDASAHGMFADGNEEQLPVCSDERVARYKMLFRRIKAAR